MKNHIRTAIVTGSSKGIGKAIALKLASEGYQLVINYRNEEKRHLAEAVAKECSDFGQQAIVFCADVSLEADCQALCSFTSETFGGIDVLVNNAGVANYGLMTRIKEDEYRKVVACNQDSVFFMMKHAAKIMKKQRYGKIINIASMAGIKGFSGGLVYSATKGAVIAMTKSASKELAGRSITVNAVAPGMIDTGMDEAMDDTQTKNVLKRIGMNRYGTPEEIAGAVAYLSSDSASYVTGAVIEIHGAMES